MEQFSRGSTKSAASYGTATIGERSRLVITLFLLTLPMVCLAQSAPPRIFYTDLESGPNSGGENNAGAYVTLYGKNFGASRGNSTVTIGAGGASAYPIWSDGKIVIQLGGAASSGTIQLTTPAGVSNGVPFTVRSGNIFFISTTGSDSNNGSFASPWKTILKSRTMAAGDITYGMNGVAQTTDDGTGWSAALTLGGNDCGTGLPRALVAYPGATVTIGTVTTPPAGIRASGPSERGGICPGGWVFSGLTLRANEAALVLEGPSNNWRVVGNDITCPNGDGASACVETSMASNVKFYGNNVHDTGKSSASALYQGVYFSTDSNHIDMGWNTVANVRGCRGIQIHSSPLLGGGASDPTGHNQFDISIHDNLIHDTQCDGIVLATVDPSLGKVEVYNNIIYNAGKGPNNPEGSGNWACVYAAGYTNTGPTGGGTVEVYGNTLYNCGTFANPPYSDSRAAVMNGGNNTRLFVRARNNAMVQPTGIPYLVSGFTGGISGSKNLFFGNGNGPADVTASVNQNPLFVNAGAFDFHLQATSPARTAGVNAGTVTDYDGVLRGSTPDIGAYQVSAGSGATTSTLSVTPSTFNATLQTTAAPATITNTGQANATFSVTANQNWINVSPSSGTVAAGSTQAVSIAVNGAGLTSGTYNGTVTVTGGDNGPQTVAVQFTVAAPALVSLVNAASYQTQAVRQLSIR